MNRVWHAVAVKVPRDRAELAQAVLWDEPLTGLEEDPEDPGHLVGYLEQPPDLARIRAALKALLGDDVAVSTRAVAEEDWLRLWKRDWKPTPLGTRLLLVPAWLRPDADNDRHVVRIEPGRAFGTGTHETTELAWELLEAALAEAHDPVSLLDVGTGTGALGLGATLVHEGLRAFATEADPQAIASLRHNLALNPCGRFHPVCAERIPFAPASFDIVVSNLTAAEQATVGEDIHRTLVPRAQLVLSGYLVGQIAPARERWEARGAQVLSSVSRGEWAALRLRTP